MSRGLLFALMLSASAAANAEIVTFSGVPAGLSPTPMTTYVENGVTITSLDGNFWAFPNPGELHLDPEGFGNSTFEFVYAGGLFDLISLDVSFAEPGAIAFLQSFDQGGNLLNSLVIDSIGTIDIDGFDGIHTLRLGNFVEHMSIDNFTITSPVPEPSTWATLLLGFGMFGLALRRANARLRIRNAYLSSPLKP